MSKIIFVVGLSLLALVACKPAGTNNCQNGDTSCDQTKGT